MRYSPRSPDQPPPHAGSSGRGLPSRPAPVRRGNPSFGTLNDAEAKNAPPRLFLLGDETLLKRAPRVSIIGSRKASQAGLDRAATYARSLAREGVVVVSALAVGIDTAAHEAAILAGRRRLQPGRFRACRGSGPARPGTTAALLRIMPPSRLCRFGGERGRGDLCAVGIIRGC